MSEHRRLGDILVERGVVPAHTIEELSRGPGRIASRLCEFGIDERALLETLVIQQGHPGIVLSRSCIDLDALGLIPKVIADRYNLLPVRLQDATLTLATEQADLGEVLDRIRFSTGMRIETLLALQGEIRRYSNQAYEAYRRKEKTLWLGDGPAPDDVVLTVIRQTLPADEMLPEDESLFADSGATPASPAPPPVAAEPAPPAAMGTVAAPLVLVVDDDDSIRHMLVTVMRHDNYQVVEAASGTAALDLLRSHRPDLVLLDAMLPEVHGFEICSTIKQSPAFHNTKVVMVSAVYRGWELSRDVQEMHQADAFVEKPFEVAYIRKLAAQMLGGEIQGSILDAAAQQQIAALRQEAEGAYRAGDDNRALAAVERWASIDPFDPLPFLVAGNIHHRNQNPGAALVAYERAATFGSQMFAAVKNLALIYEQLGFVRKAALTWRRAHALAPDDQTAAEIHARLRERFGVEA